MSSSFFKKPKTELDKNQNVWHLCIKMNNDSLFMKEIRMIKIGPQDLMLRENLLKNDDIWQL